MMEEASEEQKTKVFLDEFLARKLAMQKKKPVQPPQFPPAMARKAKEKAMGAVKFDGRSLRAKGRTEQLATRITPEHRESLNAYCQSEGIMISDAIDRALAVFFERERR